MSRILHAFKYRQDRSAGRALVWLARRYSALLDSPHETLIVPVPLDGRTLRARGFNQAAWIARGVAATHRLRLDTVGLRRQRHIAAQATLSRAGRRLQSAAEFTADKRRFEGKRVLLVDDVATTGTTLSNCALALSRAGAHRVDAVTLLGVDRYHLSDGAQRRGRTSSAEQDGAEAELPKRRPNEQRR